jgi:hypothetical protein
MANIQGQLHPQREVARMGYATVVKGGGTREELNTDKKIPPTRAATVDEQMEGDHKKSSSNYTSIQAGARKDEAQESTNDVSPHRVGNAATKSGVSDKFKLWHILMQGTSS